MLFMNVFILQLIQGLTLGHLELEKTANEVEIADFPKSADDPRLIVLQKKISWENKFSKEMVDAIREFTSLTHQTILSRLETENEYITSYLKKRLNEYGRKLADALKDNCSSPGVSISIVEQRMPAINNYFDIHVRANTYLNCDKIDDLREKMKENADLHHVTEPNIAPVTSEPKKSEECDKKMVQKLDQNLQEALGTTLNQLKDLNEKILQTEPSVLKTTEEKEKVDNLSVFLANLLNKFETENQSYLEREIFYLKDFLAHQYDVLNFQIDHVVRSKVPNIVSPKVENQLDFSSKGKIRFYVGSAGFGAESGLFDEKDFTAWYDYSSDGVINIYGVHKTIDTFLEDLYNDKKYSLNDFDPAYVYFESKGLIDFSPSPNDHVPFKSFGYISLIPPNPKYYYKTSHSEKSQTETSFNFSSYGYIGFQANITKTIKLDALVEYKTENSEVVWYSYGSYGQFEFTNSSN